MKLPLWIYIPCKVKITILFAKNRKKKNEKCVTKATILNLNMQHISKAHNATERGLSNAFTCNLTPIIFMWHYFASQM